MTREQHRINVTLDKDHATKLSRLAKRTYLQEGALARSLLSQALDEADPLDQQMAVILDSIPGAWESAQQGLREVRAGKGIPLEDL